MRGVEIVGESLRPTANLLRAGLALAIVMGVATPGSAHHSYAMFDMARSVTLEGTVREFQWTQPHAWIQLLTVDASGKEVEWSVELASPSLIARSGWTRNSLKPGDKATVVVHPLKNGQIGGSMVSVAKDGQPIGNLPRPQF